MVLAFYPLPRFDSRSWKRPVRFSSATRTPEEVADIQKAKEMVQRLYLRNPVFVCLERLAKKLPRTNKINTPEREAFRNDLVNKLYGTGASKKERRIDIVTGFPASGKTTALSMPLAECHGALLIDADFAKRLIPEYSLDIEIPKIKLAKENGIAASAVHAESNDIKDRVLERALKGGDNIVLNFLGRFLESLPPFLKELREKHGYRVNYHYVHIPLARSIERAVNRFVTEGRYFPLSGILQVGYEPKDNFEALKTMNEKEPIMDGYALYDNDVPLGTPVKVLEDTTGGCPLLVQRTSKLKN